MATTTAAQRREAARVAFDVVVAACPTRGLLDTLSSKWVSLILVALAESTHRYNALAARIPGVSPKMLTQTLRTLERDGLVRREVFAEVPVRVDYSLTELGTSVVPVLSAVQRWAEAHMDEVARHRERHDRTTTAAEPPPG